MADNTPIEWADATVNAINGCSILSPGCIRCYAMKLAGTRLRNHPSREGLTDQTKTGPVWNGTVRLHEPALLQPLRWKRPRVIFWNAHGDTFHDAVPDDWLWEMFEVIQRTRHHKHLVLTKRSARMREFMEKLTRLPADINSFYGLGPDAKLYQPIRNLWLGVSVEDQVRADERIPDLLATPAAGRFLSCEPLLGPIDLRWIAEPDEEKDGVIDALLGCNWIDGMGWGAEFRPVRPGHEGRVMTRRVCSSETDILAARKIDGVIVGGESGPGARPMHPDWARSLRDQCAAAGVNFHFKQWGNWVPLRGHGDGKWPTNQGGFIRLTVDGRRADDGHPMQLVSKKAAGRALDGATHDALPWCAPVEQGSAVA
ncbi:phage Gp37/Gp68 family protein [Sphingopyxis flava]|uniref:Protein gp37 n=1 Tax=Sphingopyxis flava TaxID=1507287 RepID=A0A1T4ZWW4_9SPHN|nr:phage Gp37/Gp68 family protein [Sphingopyxis flava]SKB26853.1 protein gp37 [Sphingopyxis flava]